VFAWSITEICGSFARLLARSGPRDPLLSLQANFAHALAMGFATTQGASPQLGEAVLLFSLAAKVYEALPARFLQSRRSNNHSGIKALA
jgi:hypothetical protein